MKNQKSNGIYYTPSLLAEYLAKPLIQNENQTILDPSYGEGALLLAAERVFNQVSNSTTLKLYGCDTKPVNGLLEHLPKANLHEIDFFDFPLSKIFHTILMNPPYVRHKIQNLKKLDNYRKTIPPLKILNNNADLWAMFLVKAVLHLKQNGNLGAILPYAFLQADYAKPLRKWLSEIFRDIKVVALNGKYFEDTSERIVVLWLKGYGEKSKTIKIASSQRIDSKIIFSKLSIDNWISDKVHYSNSKTIQFLLAKYKSEFGFTDFTRHADVKIGVVTGAVDYFIKSRLEATNIGFNSSRLKPILTAADEFPEYILHGKKNLKVLISLKTNDHLKFRKYIKEGVDGKYNQRSHSKLREPWYAVKIGRMPDAFFHYRITKLPYLLPNIYKVQCTNSIHRIYFKKITSTEKKWIMVSMLSSPCQLSIEVNSKIYGNGVLKIEPKSLKNSLIVRRNDMSINSTYNEVMRLLSGNNKDKANKVASEFIYKALNIPNDLIILTEKTLSNIQDLRHPKQIKRK